MKIKSFIAFLSLLILCTACPSPKQKNREKRLQDNNMDFPDLQRQYFKGINFMLSSMFDKEYDDDYVLSSQNRTMIAYDVDVNFSVELFDDDDAEVIQYAFEDQIDKLNAVHDNYIIKRQESLYDSEVSIKKELPKSVKFPGYIQVVHGNTYSYDDGSSYFTATIKIDDQYFVFQLIGKKDNMGYLYDDFIDILSSIES